MNAAMRGLAAAGIGEANEVARAMRGRL